MEGQLSALNMPARNLSQHELLRIFGEKTEKGDKKNETIDLDANADDDDDENDVKDAELEDATTHAGDVECAERANQRAHTKDLAVARKASLIQEAFAAASLLNNSPKVSKAIKPQIHEPWTRRSIISTDAPNDLFRGQKLVEYHTWEWSSSITSSRMREMRIVAFSAIAEHTALLRYRIQLLSDPEGGACFLRSTIERNTECHRISRLKSTPRQTKLGQPPAKQSGTSVYVKLNWPDEIKTPKCLTTGLDLKVELRRYSATHLHCQQRVELQKAINTIESLRIAWLDTTSVPNACDSPPISVDVNRSLRKLSKVWLIFELFFPPMLIPSPSFPSIYNRMHIYSVSRSMQMR